MFEDEEIDWNEVWAKSDQKRKEGEAKEKEELIQSHQVHPFNELPIIKTLSKNDLRAMEIITKRPIKTIVEYCNNEQVEWLSMPELKKLVGLRGLVHLADEYESNSFAHKHQFNKKLCQVNQSIYVNSFVFSHSIPGKTKEEDWHKVLLGHKLRYDTKAVKKVINARLPYTGIEKLFSKFEDISENFELTGHHSGILWLVTNLIQQDYITNLGKIVLGEEVLKEDDKPLTRYWNMTCNNCFFNAPEVMEINNYGTKGHAGTSSLRSKNSDQRHVFPILKKTEYENIFK